MISILALSTSIPLSDTMCPSTIPCRTMKWHFSQLRTRFTLTHRLSTNSRFSKHVSKLPPQTEKSSIKTSIIPSRKSANIAIMHLWKVAGALCHTPIFDLRYHLISFAYASFASLTNCIVCVCYLCSAGFNQEITHQCKQQTIRVLFPLHFK